MIHEGRVLIDFSTCLKLSLKLTNALQGGPNRVHLEFPGVSKIGSRLTKMMTVRKKGRQGLLSAMYNDHAPLGCLTGN